MATIQVHDDKSTTARLKTVHFDVFMLLSAGKGITNPIKGNERERYVEHVHARSTTYTHY